MAVVSCKQIGAGRNSGITKDRHRSYTVVYRVIVNSAYDGPATVISDPGIPLLYSPYVGYEHTSDPLALCTDIKPEQDGDEWQRWRVTCSFTTNWGQNQPNKKDDPEEEPPIFWIETEFVSKKVTKEWDGTDIKNSAGQLIEDIERFDVVETWVWEKNFNSINRSTWKAYQNTVNSDTVGEIEPKQGLLHIIVPKPSYRDGNPYWRVQFRVKVNKDKWSVKPRDQGTRVKNSNGKLERPVDERGQPFDGTVPLKSDGKQQLDATAEPRYLDEKDLYEPKNFSALGVFT